MLFVASASVFARAGPALAPPLAALTRVIVSASRFGSRRATHSAAGSVPKGRACYRPSGRCALHRGSEKEFIHSWCFIATHKGMLLSAIQTATASSRRPNLKHEYEVQFSSCLGTQAPRSRRSAESSFISSWRVPHQLPNPPIERTLSGLRPPRSAHVKA